MLLFQFVFQMECCRLSFCFRGPFSDAEQTKYLKVVSFSGDEGIPNISFNHADVSELTAGTPVEELWTSRTMVETDMYYLTDLSDMLRYTIFSFISNQLHSSMMPCDLDCSGLK